MNNSRFSVATLLLIVLLGVAALVRFIDVTKSPPGFYIDEAAISAQVICVRQSGANLQGQSLPLVTPVLGGGFVTAPYLYPAVAWTAVFGDSVQSFRSFAGFFSILFILGSFVFAKRFWGSFKAGWLCALAAAISPWAFQFSRIAWDPSLAPAYMVWAFALLWAEGRNRTSQLIASGALFSVAAYCYPPLRVQLAIMMPFAIALLISKERRDWKLFAIPVSVAAILSLPLLILTLSGEIQQRFQMLSIFNSTYLQQTYGSSSALNGLRALGLNMRLLLSPAYLLTTGDANLRHSTGSFGIWSYLDALGFFGAVLAVLLILSGRSKKKIDVARISFVVVGYLAGLLPAALTWESNPHALRSFGAIVFLTLGVGGALRLLWDSLQTWRSAIVGVSFAFFLMFVHVYFVDYPERAGVWFDKDDTDLAADLDSKNQLAHMNKILRERGINYDPMAVSYYQLAGGALRCPIKIPAEDR